jgi:DNA-binding GntR family transcriptional regulator
MDDSNPVQRIYLRIAAALREEIRSGVLAPGARLPAVADLCKKFGVSRHTAAHAMSVLGREGLAYREPGLGWFAAVPPRAGPQPPAPGLRTDATCARCDRPWPDACACQSGP